MLDSATNRRDTALLDVDRSITSERYRVQRARVVVPALSADMLCLADRNFFGYPLWNQARASGADLL